MRRLLFFSALVLVFPGCTYRLLNVAGENRSVTISHPINGTIFAKKEQSKDRVLQASGIVRETRGRMVDLAELRTLPRCGNAFLGSAMTLGLIPAQVPCEMHATVVEWADPLRKTRTTYLLHLTSRYSLWDSLVFRSDQEKTLGRALGWAYQTHRVVHPDPH